VVREGPTIHDAAAYKKFQTLAPFLGIDVNKVNKVTAISNEALLSLFSTGREVCQAKHVNSPALFASDDWKKEKKADLRKEYLRRCQQYISQFEWNKGSVTSVVPLIQATDRDVAAKIGKLGFATLSSRDSGFYGKGVYFTSKFAYATKYNEEKSNPAFIIAMVAVGNVFPVIESPYLKREKDDNPEGYLGKPLRTGYQSHFSLVDATKPLAYPVTDTPLLDAAVDEYVIFQDSQSLPLFIFEVSR